MDRSTMDRIKWIILTLMKTNYFENCIALTLLFYPTKNMKVFQAARIHVSLSYDFTLRCIEKAHNMVYR